MESKNLRLSVSVHQYPLRFYEVVNLGIIDNQTSLFRVFSEEFLINAYLFTTFKGVLVNTYVKRVFFEPLWEQELVLCAVMDSRIQVKLNP